MIAVDIVDIGSGETFGGCKWWGMDVAFIVTYGSVPLYPLVACIWM